MPAPTPLDAFMRTMGEAQTQHPPDCSTPRHVHASEGFANTDAATKRDKGVSRVVKVPGAVPAVNWLTEWRQLAAETSGLLPDDPRLAPVLEGLSRCDEAFLANDYPGFLRAKAAVLALMHEVPHG